jgi:hypothetical protein
LLFLFAMLQTVPVQQFPRVDAPGGMVHSLRQAVDRVCGNPANLDRTGLLAREDKLQMTANDAKPTAAAWTNLGCARAALAGDGAMARPGLLMVAGNSWADGAERSLLKALELEPGNAHAAEVLGLLALNDLQPEDLKASATAVIAATVAGANTPAILRACAELALRVDNFKASQRCATAGLARGTDSTWHMLRLSRLAFRDADTAAGVRMFFGGMAAAHDSAARDEANWHLQWFLSPTEQAAFTKVADSALSRWVRDRLAERDVRDGQRPGARLAEHFGRLEYVLENFKLDISRIARDGHGITSAQGLNNWPPDTVRSFCEPGLVPARPSRDYSRWQDRIDDRGVVWLRYGAPSKRIRATPTCDTTMWDYAPGVNQPKVLATNVREMWEYEIDGLPLILNFEAEMFSGSVEATRLVTGVLGSYMCDVDSRRCGLSALSQASWTASHSPNGTMASTDMVKPEDIEHIRQEDREFISVATTNDDNSPRGDRNVQVASQLSRLWDPLSGFPISLVTYAVPEKDLSIQQKGGERTTALDLELRQWDPEGNRSRDTVFSRHFILPDTSLKRPNLVGFVVVPSAPTVSAWSLVLTQPDHRRGRRYDVNTSGLHDGPLVLSDLVLGAETQGLVWNLHNVAIPLAPTSVLDRSATVSLYYQIKSESARSDLRTTVALYKGWALPADADTAALQVAFDQAVNSGVNEVAPTLDVSRLDKGSYRLEVRITDTAGVTITRRDVLLELE